jgi:hypothetical protein
MKRKYEEIEEKKIQELEDLKFAKKLHEEFELEENKIKEIEKKDTEIIKTLQNLSQNVNNLDELIDFNDLSNLSSIVEAQNQNLSLLKQKINQKTPNKYIKNNKLNESSQSISPISSENKSPHEKLKLDLSINNLSPIYQKYSKITSKITSLKNNSIEMNISKSPEKINKNDECIICLQEYEKLQIIKTLDCFHKYHQSCINEWLKNNDNCPICRKVIKI